MKILKCLKYVFHFFYVITNDHLNSCLLHSQCEVELFFLSELTDSNIMF